MQPIVVVRFCPVLFERDDSEAAGKQQQQPQAEGAVAVAGSEAAAAHPFDLPYKMVFAVRWHAVG